MNVSAAYISRIENDERIPSLQLLYRFADHLGVNRDWLATGQTSKSDDPELAALRNENKRLRQQLAKVRALVNDQNWQGS